MLARLVAAAGLATSFQLVAACSASSTDAPDGGTQPASPDASVPPPGPVLGSDASASVSTGSSGDAGTGPSEDASDGATATSDAASDGATDASTPARGDRVAIPVTVITDGSEAPVVLVDVSIGGSAPFQAIVDTGAAGLRVADGVVPDDAWQVSATALTPEHFPANHDTVSAVLASATMVLGGVSVPTLVPVGKITGVTCDSGFPSCVAAGTTAASFRFRSKYVANIGLGMRATDLASPLASISASGRYLMALPTFAVGGTGQMIVDPSAAEVAAFLPATQLPSGGNSTVAGVTWWDDRQVPFCLNGFCDVALYDSGEPAANILVDGAGIDAMQMTGDPTATGVSPGTKVTIDLNDNAGWTFTVQDPPAPGRDLIDFSTSVNGSNLGLFPFLVKNVLYDYQAGTVAFLHK